MHPEFWHDRWQTNKIAFHEKNGNPLLVKHLDVLALAPGARVFVPLCGKTLDIGRLLSQGFRVVGVELVESAIVQLFDELGITPQISRDGALTCYRADHLDIFVGDFFGLSETVLGPVDAVFDRAAYVALPADMRPRYAAHQRHVPIEQLRRLVVRARRLTQLLLGYSLDDKVGEHEGGDVVWPLHQRRVDHFLHQLARTHV